VPPFLLQDGRFFPFRRVRNARGDLVVPLDASPFPQFGGLADDDGLFDHEVPPGEYHVVALADGTFSEILPVTVRPGEVIEVDLTVRPPATLRVRVVDTEGAPVEALVCLLDGTGTAIRHPIGKPRRDGDLLVFDGVPAGPLGVRAVRSGEDATVRILEPTSAGTRVLLRPGLEQEVVLTIRD
jgi:hypothetical protein